MTDPRVCLLQLRAIDPNNLTVIIQSIAPSEPHQLTTDSAALIYLYNQSLGPVIGAALLAQKVCTPRTTHSLGLPHQMEPPLVP